MRSSDIVVTGGGTGGHVFPAIEVALACRPVGSIIYLGSLRGQESEACRRSAIDFQGFASEPLYSMRTLRGWRAALNLLKAQISAKQALKQIAPKVVFSTGGFASAPVVGAARSLGIPYVIHEQNTIPGRTNRILGRKAFVVATVFQQSESLFEAKRIVRTGMPVRRAIRDKASLNPAPGRVVLVTGGSQGATALNDAALQAAKLMGPDWNWIHITGPTHAQSVEEARAKIGLSSYVVREFLQAEEMADAMAGCSVGLCRAGTGTLSDLAAMRRPAILVPLPSSFADHQRFNALEFEQIGAASLVLQPHLSPERIASEVEHWSDENARKRASEALANWDVPDATERLVELVREAGSF